VNAILEKLFVDPLAQLSTHQLLDLAMQHFYSFVLVVVRMSGLMTIGPIFGQSIVPGTIRVLLVLSLSVLITPTLQGRTQQAFARFDANSDGLLTREELPAQLQSRFDKTLAQSNSPAITAVSAARLSSLQLPSTVLDFAWVGFGEFVLGLVLGLGVLTILSGLQLAGEMIDQQSGIALGEVANPGFDISGSVSGQFLFMLGVSLFVLVEPLGCHLQMIAALVDTFQNLPVGSAFVSISAIDLLRDLVHDSLIIGIQVAAPMMATMMLVGLAMGFLGHTVPQINILVIGFPIRVVVSFLVLALTLSGVATSVIDAVPTAIDNLRSALGEY
jgi:flagellar biosynthetic protein FliR